MRKGLALRRGLLPVGLVGLVGAWGALGCAGADGVSTPVPDARVTVDGALFDGSGGGGAGGVGGPDAAPVDATAPFDRGPGGADGDLDPDVGAGGDADVPGDGDLPADVGADGEVPDLGPDAVVDPCESGTLRDCPTCPGGAQRCSGDRWLACENPVERCNGLDDDCDGAVDEGFGRLGEGCVVGQGECAAVGVWRCDDDGAAAVCDAEATVGTPEGCNGVDDDCDGRIDEGPDGAPLSRACFDGGETPVGACRAGLARCVGGAFGACEGQVLPAAETCDGRDEDCDGALDEDGEGRSLREPCYGGPPGTQGVGQCRGGERTCAGGGVFGTCEGQVRPAVEICDGLDNDCDGTVDNVPGGCACAPGELRDCYAGPAGTVGVGSCRSGRQTCNADGRAWGQCQGQSLPTDERCDGVDDDCDGRTDEQVAGAGAACSAGVGACLRPGVVVCDADSGALVCGAMPGAPGVERCDGVDDDCDGRTDEGLGLGSACTEGLGECRRDGARVCGAGGAVVCSVSAGAPAPEACDGRDNDCDGVADEDLGLGDACTRGVGACQRAGQVVCREGLAACGALAGMPVAELCNGVDDDCDGQVDEGNPESNRACVAAGVEGACRAGATRCEAGALACTAGASAAETCNGLDDDCDGDVDEGADGLALSRSCFGGAPDRVGVGVCRAGTQRCTEAAFGPCVGEVLPSAEICDGLDNDCDGAVDDVAEGSCVCQAGMVRPCYAGPAGTQDVGLCRAGTQTCNAQGTGFGACEGEVRPAVETCAPADEDCDGATDDVAGLGVACSAGVGACQRPGTRQCADGPDPTCNAVPGAPAAETCNGLDDDCNGVVDDVAGLDAACTNGQGVCQRAGRRVCPAGGGALVCDAVPGAGGAETCNGLDDDCDGTVDEGTGGAACSVGLGACARAGERVCQSGSLGCSATAGAPAAETCNGIDDDCDGSADEQLDGVGVCTVGQGVCAAPGTPRCAAGVGTCEGTPGAPGAEVCDGLDNDCDGQADEALDCVNVYASCAAAQAAGAVQSAVYRLQPVGAPAPVNVYCDLSTDGGGWTLVGSTRATTLNDAGGAWYPDLATLAPAGPNEFVWNGLAATARRFDVRFACRDGVAPAAAPFTVDLVFSDVSWYGEMVAGADLDSCLSENNGFGVDLPEPARRDLVGGRFAPLGTPWVAQGGLIGTGDRYLEMEDSCGDTGDFTVDFDDRGMDSNQSDGTDWGEDDGFRKCGTSGLATGQWFVFARERTTADVVCPADDLFEPNDTLATATAARRGPAWRGIICDDNLDYFRFEGTAGRCYRFTARFTDARGDIDLRIRDAAGVVLGSGLTVTDDEVVTVTAPAGGVLVAEVEGFTFEDPPVFANDYSLEIAEVVCP